MIQKICLERRFEPNSPRWCGTIETARRSSGYATTGGLLTLLQASAAFESNRTERPLGHLAELLGRFVYARTI